MTTERTRPGRYYARLPGEPWLLYQFSADGTGDCIEAGTCEGHITADDVARLQVGVRIPDPPHDDD